jgi:hypothetical protein
LKERKGREFKWFQNFSMVAVSMNVLPGEGIFKWANIFLIFTSKLSKFTQKTDWGGMWTQEISSLSPFTILFF